MPVERIFLGWDKPCLQSAARELIARYTDGNCIDLSGAVLVFPTGRALRRLTEILVEDGERIKKSVIPPRMLTVGELPQLLSRVREPAASDTIQLLSWLNAIKNIDRERLRTVITKPPQDENLKTWMAIAQKFSLLWRECASGGVTFKNVAESVAAISDDNEEVRWTVLGEILGEYQTVLRNEGFSDPHTNTLLLLEEVPHEFHFDLVLVATADLPPVFSKFLEKINSRVLALIHAPEKMSDHFNRSGVVIPAKWKDVRIEVSNDNLVMCDGPEHQAECALEAISSLGGNYSAEEVAFGVGDPTLISFLVQRLSAEGLPVRNSAGRLIAESAVMKFLVCARNYAQTGQYSEFAALVRHPDVEMFLNARLHEHGEVLTYDLATALDLYQQLHLPSSCAHDLVEDGEDSIVARQARDLLNELLSGGSKSPWSVRASLGDWSVRLRDVLVLLYEGRQLPLGNSLHREIFSVCEIIEETVRDFMSLPASFCSPLTWAQYLTVLIEKISVEELHTEPAGRSIDVLGWLDLQLDDAPALVVLGMNEGSVPSSVSADPFLPESVRQRLGLLDNERRYARDAYAFTAMLASKKEVRVIAGRRTLRGDPVLLSRLLFACDRETAARRAMLFYGSEAGASVSRTIPTTVKPNSMGKFTVPPVPERLAKTIETLPVTAFRDYLSCPYRFYLKHVLRLKSLADDSLEMNGGLYGDLAHRVLSEFAQSSVASQTDAEKIGLYLKHSLATVAAKQFGSAPLPAVIVQLAQLEARLWNFARWQADWASRGWRIAYTEYEIVGERGKVIVDDEKFELKARIDRIDRNSNGDVMIFDYKTGDAADSPMKTHGGKRGKWKDLQLPLYHRLVTSPAVCLGENVGLGYLLISNKPSLTGDSLALWSKDDLAAAWTAAEEVIRNVRDEKFFPPSAMSGPYDDFADLCGAGQFGEMGDESVEERE